MITGAHAIVFSRDAEADRAFFRDVLGFPSVDAGGGWLIFALPPAELACHPAARNNVHELYLMCDGLDAEMAALRRRGVRCSPPQQAPWGRITRVRLPGGGDLGLYVPRHATPLRPRSRRTARAKIANVKAAARPRSRTRSAGAAVQRRPAVKARVPTQRRSRRKP
ncbi:MAG TPA: hypothetical protein VL359_11795 [bacterium]|nr:hypothetical protein [bacterium]